MPSAEEPSRTAAESRTRRKPPSLPTASEFELRAIEQLLAAHRYHELRVCLERRHELWAAEDEKRALDEARVVDERLEEAIEHRDNMIALRVHAAERVALLQFVVAFPRVAYCPLILPARSRPSPAVQRLTDERELRQLVDSETDLAELCRVLREAEALEERVCFGQARTPSEALLCICLTELCRCLIHLCCTRLQTTAENDAAPLLHDSISPPIGYLSTTVADEWEGLLKSNMALVRNTESGRNHVEGLTALLRIARHTLAFRVRVEVQAEVSLLIAEILSIFDRVLRRDTPPPGVDKRKAAKSCALSGMRLDDEPAEYIVAVPGQDEQAPPTYFHAAVAALWRRAVGDLPSSGSLVRN